MGGKWQARGQARGVGAGRPMLALGAIVAFLLAGSTALASGAGPRFGAYTAHKTLPNAGHLGVSISVDDPTTKGSIQADCSKPNGNFVLIHDWVSAILPLRHGSMHFDGVAKVNLITTTHTGAILKQSHVRTNVHVTANFAHGKFTGSVRIGGSPCQGTSYSATLVEPPKL
jgi:hypothetical protein